MKALFDFFSLLILIGSLVGLMIWAYRYLVSIGIAPGTTTKGRTEPELQVRRIHPVELSEEEEARIAGKEGGVPSVSTEAPPPLPRERKTGLRSQTVSPRNFRIDPLTKFELASLKQVGNGGEAVVYLAGDKAWKIFREPDDPFYLGDEPDQVHMRKIAKERLAAYPEKLNQFPPWLGSRVVGPERLFRVGRYSVGGYEMPLIKDAVTLRKYADADWKKQHSIGDPEIGRLFLDLYDTLRELHFCGMLVGDFKPDNVLARKHKAYIVDAESADTGDFSCLTYTEGYIDPQLCDPTKDVEVKIKPYSRTSDWYAFMVMLFESLTNVHPYHGVYLPPAGKQPVALSQRALLGISVFNKHVLLPNFAESIKHLSKKLQAAFFDFFERGVRGMPKRELVEDLLEKGEVWEFDPIKHTCWKKFTCDCSTVPENGEVTVSEVAVCGGEVASAVVIDGKPKILIRTESELRHHNGDAVLENLNGDFNVFRAGAGVTLVGNDRTNSPTDTHDGPFYLIPEDEGQATKIEEIDPSPEGSPNAVLQGSHLVWVEHGLLRRTDQTKPLLELNGSVRLFSGPTFGLVATTARGELSNLYLHKEKEVIRLISLPPIMGEVEKVDAVFSEKAAWLFLDAKWNDVVHHYILVINDLGHLVALGRVTKKSNWCMEGPLKVAFDSKESGAKGQKTEHRLAVLRNGELVIFKTSDLQVVPENRKAWTSKEKPLWLLNTEEGFHVVIKGKEPRAPEAPKVEATPTAAKAEVNTETTAVTPPADTVSAEAPTVSS